MKIFTSRLDGIYATMYIVITVFLLGIVGVSYFDEDLNVLGWSILTAILLAVVVVLSISFFFIKIKIKDEELIVSVIYNVFRINIFKITKIRIGETMWSGFHKCGTATGGLIIFSKNKNDLYITPKNQDEFLEELLKVNSHIIIEDVRK
ncbi:PH domain-containing protein [Chryseobacterium sp. FH1]|uniref:PH domain-containing protein n=1 Tax=Chryseobacterium sp. FH1 TaxID=1233951 RepID=UPI0004E432C5|nr:PH domain-containing protein [Chryseobacterium sp. FH1]KFC19932.1 hypothetical protein IO90_11960 [Chryseobacterium sp. FH1]